MTYKLFLDDERFPIDNDWKIARSIEEAILIVESDGWPEFVSFDHDLGGEYTGLDFAKYLVKRDMDNHDMPDTFTYFVHSQNPIGAENIYKYLNNYFHYKEWFM